MKRIKEEAAKEKEKEKEKRNFDEKDKIYNEKKVREEKIIEIEKEARGIVDMSSVAAGGVGAVPIPFADAIPISGIQLNMIYQINQKYNVELDAKSIIAGLGTVIGASALGRTVASSLLKFIPFVGSAAGVGTAAAITKAIGEAYIKTLSNLCKNYIDRGWNISSITIDDIVDEFKMNFKKPE